ncbi:hypothetical protein CD33_06620 [Ureibacillus sinduriensis BLB-1 = JCM 15800]|uniref:Uncharacterized protein n=1 Tax=Ureibacillus sinduriensis BLB-1 = JCM 15800 TaxID=1384057 RepID=A0A0A3INX2_9BACL|nr:hypothetical protein CD33_06620 [Ureibacillus sinduriensis BLB-1 = JCM 15800]
MKFKLLTWTFFLPLLLFFTLMFLVEISIYSILPPELGGMNIWMEFKQVWYRSVSFYAIILIAVFWLYLRMFKALT